MAVTPDTTIHLLKVPIEIDNLNQLTFANATAQYNYFISCPKKTEDDVYYQRKDDVIWWSDHIDNILSYNYVMYQNTNYSNKWFYAFITKMEYENDETTKIYIETDVFQTWQFDIVYKASFVEREHVNDDTIGKHTIPENLDIGEVTQEGTAFTFPALSSAISGFYVGIMSSWSIADNSVANPGHTSDSQGKQFDGISVYNNNVYGSQIFLIHISQYTDFQNLLLFIKRTGYDGHTNDISSIFIVPGGAVTFSSLTSHTAYASPSVSTALQFTWYTAPYSTNVVTSTASITKPTSYTNLTLKNNKCFVYPYSYILATNNAGSNNIYRYENFSTTSCGFDLDLAVSIGCSGRLIPKSYKGMTYNEDESIPLAKYPTCGWSGDAYTNWLTQNSVNLVVNAATSLVGLGVTAATFTPALSATKEAVKASVTAAGANIGLSGATNIAGLIGQLHEAKLLPNISGGQATGDVMWGNDKINIQIKCMRAKDEYLKVIDNYFTMYGYKVNEVKIPNITGRTYWNYVKTIDCNIEGDIPQEDLQIIKSMFNNGVTFWHDASKFLDYSQNNTIVVTP